MSDRRERLLDALVTRTSAEEVELIQLKIAALDKLEESREQK